MISAYLAAPLSERFRCRALAPRLGGLGVRVTSTWHDKTNGVDPTDEELRMAYVREDLAELAQAEVVVGLLDVGTPRGTLFELGFAAALSKPIVWVSGRDGHGRCLFDSHLLVHRVRGPAGPFEIARAIEIAKRRAA